MNSRLDITQYGYCLLNSFVTHAVLTQPEPSGQFISLTLQNFTTPHWGEVNY